MRRPDRWWMRWYGVRVQQPSTLFGSVTEADEWVEFGALTRWGVMRVLGRGDESAYAVRRRTWLREHS